MATISYAALEPTSGRNVESNTDLSIKVIGGHLTWKREYRDRQWRFNKSWESLVLIHDSSTGNVESILRADDIYKKLDSEGTVFKFGLRRTIRKQQDGSWLWKDRDGNSTLYDSAGKTISMHTQAGSKITLMYNGDNKLTGARDVNDVQVLWVEYDLVTGQISKAKDYGNREVVYTWQVVNNSASPKRYKLLNVKDARGYDWQYAYSGSVAKDGRVDVISMTDPENRVKAVAYAGSGRASGITNALGHTTNYQFDYIKSRKEFYLKATYPGGRVTETWYERDGEVKRRDINGINIFTITEDLRKDIVTDTFGRVTTKEYDEFKNLIKTIYPDGTSTSTTYDVSNSNILTRTDERGTIIKFEYFDNGRPKSVIAAFGTSVERKVEYTYDQFGQMLTKTLVGDLHTETSVTKYFYDGFGNKNKNVNAEGHEVQFTSFDSMGNALLKIDQDGKTWLRTYDKLGNIISEINPVSEEVQYIYDKTNNLLKSINPDLTFIEYQYNGLNKKVKFINELKAEKVYIYDQTGKIINEKDELGREFKTFFDSIGRLSYEEDGLGNTTRYIYPISLTSGKPANIFKPIIIEFPSYSQLIDYDLRGRVIKLTNTFTENNIQHSTFVETSYDPKGNVLQVNEGQGRTKKSFYDELDRVIRKVDSDIEETKFEFDLRDNLLKLTNGINQNYSFTYDKLNRKTSDIKPLGQVIQYSYDSKDNLISIIDSKNQKTINTYNEANRKIKSEIFTSSNILDKTFLFEYNSRGSLVKYTDNVTEGIYTYDDSQQKLSETIQNGSNSFAHSYTYNLDGAKSTFTGIDNIKYQYYYNNIGMINNIVIPNEGNINYQSFDWKRPTKISYPGNIVTDKSYDGLQRIKTISVKNSTDELMMNHQLTYSETGNISTKNTLSGNTQYEYDNLNRLTSVDYPNLEDEQFTYDSIGNRLISSSTSNEQWTYNENSEIQDSVNHLYSFDENGNIIERKNDQNQVEKSYIYNTQNRLVEIRNSDNSLLVSYYYDPFGSRLSKTVINPDQTQSITYFIYNDEGLSAEVTNSQISTYLYNPQNSWMTSPIAKKLNNKYYYYQNDHIGTPQIIHDNEGNVVYRVEFKAFGEKVVSINSINDPLAFPGQYQDDETDTLYNFHRDYDPSVGRYIQADPIGLFGGVNNYLYANGNPIQFVDLFGLNSELGKVGCDGNGSFRIFNNDFNCTRDCTEAHENEHLPFVKSFFNGSKDRPNCANGGYGGKKVKEGDMPNLLKDGVDWKVYLGLLDKDECKAYRVSEECLENMKTECDDCQTEIDRQLDTVKNRVMLCEIYEEDPKLWPKH
jgi:RHS repeat-associated protein